MYASLVFNPTAVRSYTAIFEANVVNGTDPKTNKLTFEVRGEATLPQVSILQPNVKSKQGQPLLKFKRLLLGRSQVRIPIT